jgi:UDP-glucose 6-dehydrogenase
MYYDNFCKIIKAIVEINEKRFHWYFDVIFQNLFITIKNKNV